MTKKKPYGELMRERYGEDFFQKRGAKGGKAPATKPKGFAARPDIAKLAGQKGGSLARIKESDGRNGVIES